MIGFKDCYWTSIGKHFPLPTLLDPEQYNETCILRVPLGPGNTGLRVQVVFVSSSIHTEKEHIRIVLTIGGHRIKVIFKYQSLIIKLLLYCEKLLMM